MCVSLWKDVDLGTEIRDITKMIKGQRREREGGGGDGEKLLFPSLWNKTLQKGLLADGVIQTWGRGGPWIHYPVCFTLK